MSSKKHCVSSPGQDPPGGSSPGGSSPGEYPFVVAPVPYVVAPVPFPGVLSNSHQFPNNFLPNSCQFPGVLSVLPKVAITP